MGPALFAITLESMKSDVDEVALQGTLNNYDLFIRSVSKISLKHILLYCQII